MNDVYEWVEIQAGNVRVGDMLRLRQRLEPHSFITVTVADVVDCSAGHDAPCGLMKFKAHGHGSVWWLGFDESDFVERWVLTPDRSVS